MPIEYAVCPVCESCVVLPTAYSAHLDGQAQVHARLTGHTVQVFNDEDPDGPVRLVVGEPALPY